MDSETRAKSSWGYLDSKWTENACSILAHPSETLCYVEYFPTILMSLVHGIKTIEPWTTATRNQSNLEYELIQ